MTRSSGRPGPLDIGPGRFRFISAFPSSFELRDNGSGLREGIRLIGKLSRRLSERGVATT